MSQAGRHASYRDLPLRRTWIIVVVSLPAVAVIAALAATMCKVQEDRLGVETERARASETERGRAEALAALEAEDAKRAGEDAQAEGGAAADPIEEMFRREEKRQFAIARWETSDAARQVDEAYEQRQDRARALRRAASVCLGVATVSLTLCLTMGGATLVTATLPILPMLRRAPRRVLVAVVRGAIGAGRYARGVIEEARRGRREPPRT